MKISFGHDYSNPDRHLCKTSKDGDWVIFTCPICKDYEKRYNMKTTELTVKGNDDFSILHDGSYSSMDPIDWPWNNPN